MIVTLTSETVCVWIAGDVRVVAAMGDSLIAGNGAMENNAFGAFIESRGVSWAAGKYVNVQYNYIHLCFKAY